MGCRKSTCRCGVKHISKLIVQKIEGFCFFWMCRCGFAWLLQMSKTQGSCSFSKSDARHGTFEKDLQRCIFRGMRSTRNIFIRVVRRSWKGLHFGIIIRSLGLHFAWPDIFFRDKHNSLDRRIRKNYATYWYEAVSSALNFILEGNFVKLLRFWCYEFKENEENL